ncbi:MAG: MoaD/ThiS family protein [Gemmatimonadaceae bacterium]|nr:MoaD/ThiS family protein [Gemmatimonadaceae bacterium]
MTLRVLLFASYADALGASEIDVDLPAGATVRDLIASVHRRAGNGRIPPSPLVAVNQRYASLDTPVSASDEIAIIPPVAGG